MPPSPALPPMQGKPAESGVLAPAPFVNVPARPRRAGTFLLDWDAL